MECAEFGNTFFSGDFLQYTALVTLGIKILPFAGPMFAVTIIISISTYRKLITVKQNNAEDLGRISKNDLPRYQGQNANNNNSVSTTNRGSSTTGYSSDSSVSSNSTITPDTIGNNPDQDYSNALQRYINDLYNVGTEGDNLLRSAGLH